MSKKNRRVVVLSMKDQTLIADKCIVAESFFTRLKGLIGKDSYELGEGLLLLPCNDIHMWFMKIPIDVVFLKPVVEDTTGEVFRVTSFRKNLHPWKLWPVRDGKAVATLELPVDSINRCTIEIGDKVCIR